MLRKLNRVIQDYMRGKRLGIGRWLWDKKERKEEIKEGNFIKENRIEKILFLRYDGKIGDMVINSVMFRELKKRYPDIYIGVIARGGAEAVIENNPCIDKIYRYDKGNIKGLAEEIAAEKYDLLIDFSEMLRVNQMKFINLCRARFNMGLEREGWELFDISYEKEKEMEHISRRYQKVLEILGIKNPDMSYDLHFTEEQNSRIDNLLKEFRGKEIIVLNPFAASRHRDLNRENIEKICMLVLEDKNTQLFIVGEEKRKKEIESIIEKFGTRITFPQLEGIMETACLISRVDLVITPDTSIIHIAAAFNRNLLAVYRLDGSRGNEINSSLWGPNSDKAVQIFSRDMNLKDGEEADINKFDMREVENYLKNFREGVS